MMLVSADFAHGLAPSEARDNDQQSLRALAHMDAEAILGFGDEHLDAPAAVAVAMAVAERIGARRFSLLRRGDGSELPGYAGGPVTSYVTGYYARPVAGSTPAGPAALAAY